MSALSPAIPRRRWKLPRFTLATAGFLLIWAFLLLFVFYPLTRIFYDAFTNEAGLFTFANFVEGKSNQLARAAAVQVAQVQRHGQQRLLPQRQPFGAELIAVDPAHAEHTAPAAEAGIPLAVTGQLVAFVGRHLHRE